MNIFEIHHRSKAVYHFRVSNLSSSGDISGEIIDTAGYEAAELVFVATAFSGGSAPVVLFESDDSGMAGATQVSADEQLGNPIFTSTNLILRFGYIGKKQYVRATVQSGLTVISEAYGVCLLTNALSQPTFEQPS